MKNKILVSVGFTALYTVFFSLGLACFLGVFGAFAAASLDNVSATAVYPIFLPFCLIVGLLSLIVIIVALIYNAKLAKEVGLTTKAWIAEFVCTFVFSIPMLFLWEFVFEFLEEMFSFLNI